MFLFGVDKSNSSFAATEMTPSNNLTLLYAIDSFAVQMQSMIEPVSVFNLYICGQFSISIVVVSMNVVLECFSYQNPIFDVTLLSVFGFLSCLCYAVTADEARELYDADFYDHDNVRTLIRILSNIEKKNNEKTKQNKTTTPKKKKTKIQIATSRVEPTTLHVRAARASTSTIDGYDPADYESTRYDAEGGGELHTYIFDLRVVDSFGLRSDMTYRQDIH
jgi:hypothetical protein